MSQRELDRYEIIQRSLKRELTVKEAGELIHLSDRHVHRLKAMVRKRGALALVHGNRGRPSNRRVPKKEREAVRILLHERYHDFKPTHATEKLRELHGIARDPGTIRRIMTEEGLWKPRKKRSTEYRCSRPRKERYGEMQQFDGSYHDWLETGGRFCLLAAIDDATGKMTGGHLTNHEGTFAIFDFFERYFLEHGRPLSIYLDRLQAYHNNHPSLLGDEEALTQFQRGMRAYGVRTIVAHSPQAKGRVERLFGTLQDRLIKEMRLRKIKDVSTANNFLKEEFIPWFNEKYGRRPVKDANLHRKLTREEKSSLPSVFSRQSERTIQNDFTLRFSNAWYQLAKEQPATVRPKETVTIEERRDGSVCIRLRGRYLNYSVTETKPQRQAKQCWVIPASQRQERTFPKPSKENPWRRFVINQNPDISKSLKP